MKLLKTLSLIFFAVLFAVSVVYAAKPSESAYYVRVNIWYEEPAKILSTNYHRGAIIAYGAKVNVENIGDDKIQFTTEGEPGVNFTLVNVRKYSLVETDELFQQYFTPNDPKARGGEFDKFSAKEKENIENGTIEPGMSKDAVVAAYGNPPKHKTPALTSNLWTYWNARSTRSLVSFKNDKVVKAEEINEYDEGRPRWYHYVP